MSGAVEQLTKLYEQALRRSGLPYRTSGPRMAEQLAATGEAAAYAQALALMTGEPEWERRAAERGRDLRSRLQLSQSDINSGDRAESKLRRYGLGRMLP